MYMTHLEQVYHALKHKPEMSSKGVGVLQGVVINKGNQRNVLVQRIEDDSLGGNRKTLMLREFDAHVRIGSHPNVVSLVGLMEEFNVISVAFEYETSTLKTQLVESRAVQHYPVYAEKNRRFSTLLETQVSMRLRW